MALAELFLLIGYERGVFSSKARSHRGAWKEEWLDRTLLRVNKGRRASAIGLLARSLE